MDKKGFDEYVGTIEDAGLHTALVNAGFGELTIEAITFNKLLHEKGYQLTTYYGTNFTRCWAIYTKNEIRPKRSTNCPVIGHQYFHIKLRVTKKCTAFEALEKIKIEFNNHLKTLSGAETSVHNSSGKMLKKYHEDETYNEILNELTKLVHSEDLSSIETVIEKLKSLNNLELEEIINGKIGYKSSKYSYGHLYIKHGSIFEGQLTDNKIITGNIWYAILSIIGYSQSKKAIAIKQKAESLEFPGKINMSHIPKEIGAFKNLKYLSFRGFNIVQLPNEIGELTELLEFNLEFTKLTKLPASICNLTKLVALRLYNSKLQSLPKEIGELKELEILTLGDNNISELPSSIGQLKKLKEFNLWRNPLNSIPKAIWDLGILTERDLIGLSLNKEPTEL